MSQLAGYLAAEPVVFFTGSLLLGLIVGSFLNVVIYRLPVMMERDWRAQCRELLQADEAVAEQATPQEEQPTAPFNLLLPNSHCPHCDHEIRPWENLPVVSYLLLRGRCSHCHAGISPRYPLIEAFCALLSLIVAWKFGPTAQTAGLLAFTWALLAASMIDLDHMLLPDDIVLPLLWLGLIVNSFGLIVSLPEALWGAIAGYMSLWLVFQTFRLLTGKEGMGYGDFKLLAALGAWLGWQQLPLIILMASASGAVLGVLAIALKLRERSQPIPFGPFLACGGWICAIWGTEIQRVWLGQ